jgi:hypothetical protein
LAACFFNKQQREIISFQQAAVSTTPPKCPSPASSSDSDDLAPTTSKVAKLAEPLKKEPRKYAPDTTIRLTISNVRHFFFTRIRFLTHLKWAILVHEAFLRLTNKNGLTLARIVTN